MNHRRLLRITAFFLFRSKLPLLFISTLAIYPEILVNGVRKSCEIERNKFARNRSFLASIAASSFFWLKNSFSRAKAHSPTIDSTKLFSKASRITSSKNYYYYTINIISTSKR